MDYTINEDGTVTRHKKTNSTPNSGGGSDNSGCWIFLVIAIIVGIIIAIANNQSSSSTSQSGDFASEVESVEAYEEPFITISSSNVNFEANGGSYTFEVNSNTSWDIITNTESWGHLQRSGSNLILTVDRNYSTDDRTDYFELSTGEQTVMVSISQEGAKPSAEISRIWLSHDEFYDGIKGMIIHVGFSTENLKDQLIYVKTCFYYEDNVTPLHDVYGSDLVKTLSARPSYDSATFQDFEIFIPLYWFDLPPGYYDLSFDVILQDQYGEQLDICENTTFTFSRE